MNELFTSDSETLSAVLNGIDSVLAWFWGGSVLLHNFITGLGWEAGLTGIVLAILMMTLGSWLAGEPPAIVGHVINGTFHGRTSAGREGAAETWAGRTIGGIAKLLGMYIFIVSTFAAINAL
ncbi:hypothetical protein [Nitrosomonas sp. ANs5]|uniref:hypothetical protein n=1 Tax=Nitrosomonas sp. ANs5 TaxID=3423941 RepID=UPI003D327670